MTNAMIRRLGKVATLAALMWMLTPLMAGAARLEGMPEGSGSYEDFVALFQEFLAWQDPERASGDRPNRDIAGAAADVHPDYGAAAVAARVAQMQAYQERLEDMAVVDWPLAQQVELLAVRSRFDQHEFTLKVSRPWSRDPGFYVDQILRLTFADLPLADEQVRELQVQLKAVSLLAAQAMNNLTEVAADYADLAIFNLSNADGVGHGFPYRSPPPAGVIGWYADLAGRAAEQQPELLDDIAAARQSVESFYAWLVENRAGMTGLGGVGEDNFNWYLKHVKLMPYNTDQIVTLGLRELDRLWTVLALEQHRNRHLPKIELPGSAEEYAARLADTDKRIREFLVEKEVITIPDYVQELGTNVPWIVRPGGPNFWENVQYRNPTPDHLHAVIPGHRFDGVVERNNKHPIRGKITSGARPKAGASTWKRA